MDLQYGPLPPNNPNNTGRIGTKATGQEFRHLVEVRLPHTEDDCIEWKGKYRDSGLFLVALVLDNNQHMYVSFLPCIVFYKARDGPGSTPGFLFGGFGWKMKLIEENMMTQYSSTDILVS